MQYFNKYRLIWITRNHIPTNKWVHQIEHPTLGVDFIEKLDKEIDISQVYDLLDEMIFEWLDFSIKGGCASGLFADKVYIMKILRDAFKEYQKPNP